MANREICLRDPQLSTVEDSPGGIYAEISLLFHEIHNFQRHNQGQWENGTLNIHIAFYDKAPYDRFIAELKRLTNPETCQFCKQTLVWRGDMQRYYCITEGCKVQGIPSHKEEAV